MKLNRIVVVLLGLLLVHHPEPVSAASVSIFGKAKVSNTDNSYLDFTNYNSNVAFDNITGIFSGYAFSEDTGWVTFGTTDNPLGPVSVNLVTGAVTGKAKALNTDTYLDFSGYQGNVSVNIATGIFSGYVFSEDAGWLDFSDTGIVSSPPDIEIDGPSVLGYTNNQRPTIKWKAPNFGSESMTKYKLEFDNGDTGDFSVDSIPASGQNEYEVERFTAKYDNFNDSDLNNNYISVFTKSSSIWNGNENKGELKEGKRSVTVSAYNNAGSIKTDTREFYVDITAPVIEISKINDRDFASFLATNDTTPTIFGKITDNLAGDKTTDKVASGPKSAEIKIEKKNLLGLYTLHSLATVNITQTYWFGTYEKISDNVKNTSDKYSDFSFTPAEGLPAGTYKISVTGKDLAENAGGSVSFNLTIGNLIQVTPAEDKEVVENTEITPETVIKVPEEVQTRTENVTTNISAGFLNLYWKIVDSGKFVVKQGIKLAENTGKLWQSYANFVRNTDLKILAFIVKQTDGAGQIMIVTYNNLAQKAPGVLGDGMRTVGNAFGAIADTATSFSGSFAGYVSGATRNLGKSVTDTVSPLAKTIGEFTKKQQIKMISIAEILFDKNPTIIKNVKVVEVGKDYAVITWETNHYTTNNKINYGENLSYGQDVISQERARLHKFKITGLGQNKKYYFEVMSKNNNYIYDAYHEFTTTNH